MGKRKTNKIAFFLSALLQDCSLCWDRTPTLDAALLISSRVGTDMGRMSDNLMLEKYDTAAIFWH